MKEEDKKETNTSKKEITPETKSNKSTNNTEQNTKINDSTYLSQVNLPELIVTPKIQTPIATTIITNPKTFSDTSSIPQTALKSTSYKPNSSFAQRGLFG